MAGTLTISTLSDGTNSTSATNPIRGSAKAWVNFNGTGTVAIRASYNVSSITDNGTGDYTVNFTNALPDANYCAVVPTSPAIGVSLSAGAWFGGVATNGSGVPLTKTTTALRIRMGTQTGPGGSVDTNETNVVIFD